MAVRQLDVLEFGELLGALLRSIVAAQEQSARATVEFIEAVGLINEDGTSALRTVALRFRKRDENGNVAEFEVEVPLLTLVNPPALSVSEATLSFGYELLGTERGADPPTGVLPVERIKLRGVVRSTPAGNGLAEQRSSFTVNVNVTVKQEPTPIGVQRLFDLAELGIQEKAVPPQ
jgi:hypothetical protein